ncbi:MAG TPA: SAM-dependent methyltransferase [Pseudonocardiaceae bacterium]|nr:SAM-dependent methyltransferase [Pseudonocardiaceae bacterium]
MSAPTGVGMTAVVVAYARSIETARRDQLFSDPWAEDFVRASGWSLPERQDDTSGSAPWTAMLVWTVVRTCFLDEVVLDATRAGCEQVVLLGAGLDTRALRLPLPPRTQVFEVDTAEVLDFKDSVLASADHRPASNAGRVTVRGDLRGPWAAALLKSGFEPRKRTVWVAEGLLQYLSPQDNELLLARVGELSPPRSRLGATLTPPGTMAARPYSAGLLTTFGNVAPENVRDLWRSDGPADPQQWLARHGWQATIVDAAQHARTLGRDIPDITDSSAAPRRSLVDAIKLSDGRRSGLQPPQ